jgi:hypothetical protein
MAYTINNTQGAVVTTVQDNTLDTTTDLTLIGRNKTGFGESLNENLIKLLENFASSSAPPKPVRGQLWYDTVNDAIKVNTSTTSTASWKFINSVTPSVTAPTSPAPSSGDIWYDTNNKQLKVYNGSSWDLVGPDYTQSQGVSGQKVSTILDSGSGTHIIVEFWVSGTLVAIFSKDSTPFNPSPAITGFSSISPGLNLNSTITGINSGNAATLNSLTSNQFLRSDIATALTDSTAATSTTTGALTVTGGVGIGGNLYVSANIVASGTNVLNAISVISAQVVSVDTKLSNAISAMSAQLVSVDNKLSNAISAVNAAVGGNFTSAVNVLSNTISTISAQLASVDTKLSNAVSAVSSQLTSVDTKLSNAVSVVSAAAASIESHVNTVSNAVSALSASLVSTNNTVSNLVSVVSVVNTNAGLTGQVFVSSTSFIIPQGVSKVKVTCLGAGGGGGGYNSGQDQGGGGGGSGGIAIKYLTVTSGSTYTVTVGSGGAKGSDASPANTGVTGGTSKFSLVGTDLCTATGGSGGGGGQTSSAGTGGSAGTGTIADLSINGFAGSVASRDYENRGIGGTGGPSYQFNPYGSGGLGQSYSGGGTAGTDGLVIVEY